MISSTQKVIRILNAVSEGGADPMPLYKIADKTGINKATCSHIINTLLEEGYMVRISASKGYVLGPAAYCLSSMNRYGGDLISICRPVMQYLYKTLGHCVVLSVIEGGTKYVIDYIDDGSIFQKQKKIQKDDIYRTATGRAILKNMSRDEIDVIWQKYGCPSEGDWSEIRSLRDLYDYCDNEHSRHVISTRKCHGETIALGYALPLLNNIKCVGALGIAVKIPLSEEKSFFAEEEKNIKKMLLKGADIIEQKINL
ncbi:MAG: helix-turn-helix domain-containing protein [Clostridia bacterium]|nr:helix-turn-helix domain-containing protein [Clostridia bacterium]